MLSGFKTDMLRDDPAKSVLILSIPVIILNILKAGYNIVDMFWLGHLGKDYLAGVSASIFLIWAMHALSALVTVGIVAGISRNIGEDKVQTAKSNTWRSLKLSLFLGFVLTFFLYPMIDPLVGLIDLEPVAYKAGIEYLRIMIIFTPLGFLMFSLHSVMIAWGDTKTPVKVYGTTFLLNIILSPVLMLGMGPFPRLETKGAALATVASYLVGSILFIVIILRNKWIVFKKVGQEIPFRRYITVGYPVALTWMFFSIVYYFIAKVAASFGTDVVAAMGIGHKVEALAYFFATGLAAGVSTFVARNLGAGREDRAKAGAVSAIKFVSAVIFVYSLTVFIFPDLFVSIFNSDPSLVREGVNYLRIVMPAEIIQAVLIIIESGAFAGAGYTKPSFYISLPVVFLKIPLAWFLAVELDMAGNGVWITIALSMLANGVVFILLFRKNSWLKAKV